MPTAKLLMKSRENANLSYVHLGTSPDLLDNVLTLMNVKIIRVIRSAKLVRILWVLIIVLLYVLKACNLVMDNVLMWVSFQNFFQPFYGKNTNNFD